MIRWEPVGATKAAVELTGSNLQSYGCFTIGNRFGMDKKIVRSTHGNRGETDRSPGKA